ncbi:MAG: bifunctional phosphopantothenoylcysteine decarboxylase/phosphopantothenate--cysteine ligase CoaBC [Thaumarchaeota archaeon]|nr:bifunctional phosphopantothenoylcysteine decarboxylase/phosphopantothenate--cysteine ligase CoaBC [Nitrososphaerota archaeon]
MRDHPSLDIVGSGGSGLAGRRIVLCVSGSVAAYKAIELARLLMRHGADVTCVASRAATGLIRPSYFKWATGNDVVTKLTGDLEHIKLADYKRSDLIVVYPCTANTLGKLAHGIDDTPISTVLSVGFGSKIPIIISLAMHQAMYENPAVARNIGFLRDRVIFMAPQFVEGKAKAAEPEQVLDFVLKKFGVPGLLRGRRVLMTAGPTLEYIDPVRVITNRSSGRTGVLLARELASRGAKVTLIYGPGSEQPPREASVVRVETGREMLEAVRRELRRKFDIVILAAAVSDYSVETPSRKKIKSNAREITVRLRRAPKIIDEIKRVQKGVFLVGFKAETDVPVRQLVALSRRKMAESGADLIVANDIGARYKKNPGQNSVFLVDATSQAASGRKDKEKIARFIAEGIARRFLNAAGS